MTLMDWLQSHQNSHLISECFHVHNDLVHAQENLKERAHLLPMSDASLLNFSIGIAVNGDIPVLQWPSTQVSSLSGWLSRIPNDFSNTIIVRVSCGELSSVNWTSLSHPKLQVWSITADSQRTAILNEAQGIVVLIESSVGMALNHLESRFNDLNIDLSTTVSVENPTATILVPNVYFSSVESALDELSMTSVEVVAVHNLTDLTTDAVNSIQRTGRVVNVELPEVWVTAITKQAFWHLEAEPEFCSSTTNDIHRALSIVWED